MPILVFLILLLSSCSAPPEAQLIDTYLADSAAGRKSHVLVGSASLAQENALAVVKDLGWSQSGKATYTDLRPLQNGELFFCLDVSKVAFLDSTGNRVPLDRPLSQLRMKATVFGKGEGMKIESLEEVGTC